MDLTFGELLEMLERRSEMPNNSNLESEQIAACVETLEKNLPDLINTETPYYIAMEGLSLSEVTEEKPKGFTQFERDLQDSRILDDPEIRELGEELLALMWFSHSIQKLLYPEEEIIASYLNMMLVTCKRYMRVLVQDAKKKVQNKGKCDKVKKQKLHSTILVSNSSDEGEKTEKDDLKNKKISLSFIITFIVISIITLFLYLSLQILLK